MTLPPLVGVARAVPALGLLAIGEQLVVHTAHQQTLFLEQTVADALGGEAWGVRKQASFEASHALLAALATELGVTRAEERLELAAALFAALGHGRLRFEVGAEGGTVHGESLLGGRSRVERHGGTPRGRRPVDAFAAGWVAAAASLAFPSDWGLFDAEETTCVARGDDACSFTLARRLERPRFGVVVTRTRVEKSAAASARVAEVEDGEQARTAAGVSTILAALSADDRGRLRVFGVNLGVYPASYLAQSAFDTMHLVEKRSPELFSVYAALVREAAQTGTFHLLGGLLSSSQWIADFGLPAREPEARLQQLLGVARALGWGALEAGDFDPGRRLVLRAALTPESAYYAVRHGSTVRSRLATLQGTALGLMQLLHRVDFSAERPIVKETYDALFKSGVRFHAEESASTLRGDATCEVMVEALADR